jgi:hypothetical protein
MHCQGKIPEKQGAQLRTRVPGKATIALSVAPHGNAFLRLPVALQETSTDFFKLGNQFPKFVANFGIQQPVNALFIRRSDFTSIRLLRRPLTKQLLGAPDGVTFLI